MSLLSGYVSQVIGPVVDVTFLSSDLKSKRLPSIYSALTLQVASPSGGKRTVILEVQQHIGKNRVRAVAMSATEGLARLTKVQDMGSQITVPVGKLTLGRILDVTGEELENQL
jgi:F-type H+-transporting ATPase subunit beta